MKPSQEAISMRAYEIFEGSGNTQSPEHNWLQAEHELTHIHQPTGHGPQHKLEGVVKHTDSSHHVRQNS